MVYFYSFLLKYRYHALFPIAVVEGPVVILLASFLASQGLFNIYAVYVIAVLGNLTGDTIYYLIGRFGRHSFIRKYGKYIGITDERVVAVEEHYKNHLLKTIFLSKMINAGIEIFLVAAGLAKVKYRKYITIIFLIEIPKNIVIVAVGYYFGAAYLAISQYYHNFVLGTVILVLFAGLLYLVNKRLKSFKNKI